jgi:hypothetical protein
MLKLLKQFKKYFVVFFRFCKEEFSFKNFRLLGFELIKVFVFLLSAGLTFYFFDLFFTVRINHYLDYHPEVIFYIHFFAFFISIFFLVENLNKPTSSQLANLNIRFVCLFFIFFFFYYHYT